VNDIYIICFSVKDREEGRGKVMMTGQGNKGTVYRGGALVWTLLTREKYLPLPRIESGLSDHPSRSIVTVFSGLAPLLKDSMSIFYVCICIYIFCDMTAKQPKEWNYAAIARQRHSKHVSSATDTRTTIDELLEVVSSVRSLPRLYNENLRLVESLVSCEAVASRQRREDRRRGITIVGSRYLATTGEDIGALMFAVVICKV
jgi:hypothetical protein